MCELHSILLVSHNLCINQIVLIKRRSEGIRYYAFSLCSTPLATEIEAFGREPSHHLCWAHFLVVGSVTRGPRQRISLLVLLPSPLAGGFSCEVGQEAKADGVDAVKRVKNCLLLPQPGMLRLAAAMEEKRNASQGNTKTVS